MRATLKKSDVLRGNGKFQEVFEKGYKRNGKHLRYFVLERKLPPGSAPSVVIGFVVRRTISRAVDRNRIKRLLRESFRTNKTILHSALRDSSIALSIVLMYAPQSTIPVGSLCLREIDDELKVVLTSIASHLS